MEIVCIKDYEEKDLKRNFKSDRKCVSIFLCLKPFFQHLPHLIGTGNGKGKELWYLTGKDYYCIRNIFNLLPKILSNMIFALFIELLWLGFPVASLETEKNGNTELFSHLNEREHLSGHILEVLRMVFFFFIHSSHSVNNFCLFCLTYKTDLEHIESKKTYFTIQTNIILFHHYP